METWVECGKGRRDAGGKNPLSAVPWPTPAARRFVAGYLKVVAAFGFRYVLLYLQAYWRVDIIRYRMALYLVYEASLE
jgi:hypothetical protein